MPCDRRATKFGVAIYLAGEDLQGSISTHSELPQNRSAIVEGTYTLMSSLLVISSIVSKQSTASYCNVIMLQPGLFNKYIGQNNRTFK